MTDYEIQFSPTFSFHPSVTLQPLVVMCIWLRMAQGSIITAAATPHNPLSPPMPQFFNLSGGSNLRAARKLDHPNP